MSEFKGILFKQWYKPANLKSTPLLNKKHLIYISTKIKEAVYNPGCGFCLWGQLGGMKETQNIDDFELAKKTVDEVSERRTIYRCILSLSHEDATEKGFYNRESWQQLISKNITSIAKEMDIKQEDFNWVASFHYKHGHPHCHIMYWDNGNSIRDEYVPDERFEIISEKVRASFNKDIFADELKSLRKDQQDIMKEIRLDFNGSLTDFGENVKPEELKAVREELFNLIGELKPADTINISAVPSKELLSISKQLLFVASLLPGTGSLKYQYLPTSLKKELDKLSDLMLKTSVYSSKVEQYLKDAEEISRQYGNGEKSIEHNREHAYLELLKSVGNNVLKFIKDKELIGGVDDLKDDLL